MKKLFDVYRWTPSVQKVRAKYRIVFINGGSKQGEVKQFALEKDTVVIAIDCDEEFTQRQKVSLLSKFRHLSAAERSPLATLIETVRERVRGSVTRHEFHFHHGRHR